MKKGKKTAISVLAICLLQMALFSGMLLQTTAAEKRELSQGEAALGSENNWKAGDRIVGGLGSYAYGTDETDSAVQPIVWSVLDTKTNMGGAAENDGLFLVSKNVLDGTLWNEYEIRSGKYYKEGANTFANEWEGSIAQAWCQSFYKDTIQTSVGGEKVILTTKTDEPITLNNCWNGNTYSYGESKIEDEYVFFLSVGETEEYFENDAQRAASGSIIFYWTRSPHDVVGRDPRACYIHNDGTRGRHMGVDAYGARPALNLDYKDLWFKKVTDGEYIIITEEEANNSIEEVKPEQGGEEDTQKQYIEVDGVKVEVETIQNNGPDNENIVWVIAGDGYTESELTKYREKVDEIFAYFFQTEPYNQFKDKINIYALKTISNTSGFGTGDGGENDTVFGIHQGEGAVCDIGDKGLDFIRSSCQALKESLIGTQTEITSYQIISNATEETEYCGTEYMNGMLSIFTDNYRLANVALRGMGHTHGLADENDSNSSGVNTAYKQKGVDPDVNTLSWRKFLGYKGVGAYEKPSYPQITPKYDCIMNDYAQYCPVCKAHVFDTLNQKLNRERILLYQDDMEITTAEEPGYVFADGNIYDVHSNDEGRKIDTIGSENITEANGKKLEARTIVRSYANEAQNYELKLEIKSGNGTIKYVAQMTFMLLCNELESLSVVTEELSGLVDGDTLDVTLKKVDRSVPVKPLNKIIVENINALTAEEKKAIEDAVREANQNTLPADTQVKVENNNEVKITYPDGSTDTMQVAELAEEKGVINYTVTFNTNGGSAVEPQKVAHNAAVALPEEPTRAGFRFLGWYKEDQRYDFSAAVQTDLILTAKWLDLGEVEDGDQEKLEDRTEIAEKIWVAGVQDLVYNGKKQIQSLRVYDGNKLLTEKKDYTLSYKNNQEAYILTDQGAYNPAKAPQVTISMRGDYSGKKTLYFQILPKSLSDSDILADDLYVNYNGKEQKVAPVVSWNGRKLSKNDFTVTSEEGKNLIGSENETTQITLTLTGCGNYTGTREVTLTIARKATDVAMSKVKVTVPKSISWAEFEKAGFVFTENAVKVEYQNNALVQGEDYTVRYENNKAVGKATLIVEGMEGTDKAVHYYGQKRVTFQITGISMSRVKAEGLKKSYVYSQKAMEPLAWIGENGEPAVILKVDNRILQEEDYYVVYSNNVDKGTASMTVTGNPAAGYTGSKKFTFKIVAKPIAGMAAFAENGEATITTPIMKGGAKPAVAVTDGNRQLTEGKDYTLVYGRNTKAASASATAAAPVVTVKGKGNYTGSTALNFTIENKPIGSEGIVLVAKDKEENLKKGGFKQSFKIYDADGKALTTADYDAKSVVYTLVKNANGEAVEQVLDPKTTDKIKAGSVIQITVTGKGAYAGGEEDGTISGTYRILAGECDISKAKIKIADQEYTGKAVEIKESDMTEAYIPKGKAKVQLMETENGSTEYHFEIVEGSYVNNVKKGTAKVTLRGTGEFGGEKVVTFKITQRNVEKNWWEEMMERFVFMK